ncbi:MAG: helix-turn-helix transcriptional regulator [Lachnospiraceae bacterium]|nr:helix-turn-helix transcriptional regulator [Lachnospiraceae bacterium]
MLRLHEQITFLRKQCGWTQEELAQQLGVSNQAVSKWESGQCCPDIQLLPELAKIFRVSIDELMGYCPEGREATQDLVPQMCKQLEELPEGEDFKQVFRLAAALHTMILSKWLTTEPNGNSGWNTEEAIKHAARAEWGYSCVAEPLITTIMRRGTILFSNNTDLGMQSQELQRVASLIKPFGEPMNLRVAVNLYRLTVGSEESYATVEEIAQACELSEEKVDACLQKALLAYLREQKKDGKIAYRFEGMYLSLIPMLSLFDMR